MPRHPSKHGLEKKYKSWRKGKSAASGNSTASRASLKNQLRSQRRLLSKVPTGDDPEASTARAAIKDKIAELESQISGKAKANKERKNAEKYHQVRFFDRQKLTRMERTARRNLEEAKLANDVDQIERYEAELRAIILDKLYVAYFPHDHKYVAIFANGARVHDDEATAKIRRKVRDRIISNLWEGKLKSKSWFDVEESKAYLKNLSTNVEMDDCDAGRGRKEASRSLSTVRSHKSGSSEVEKKTKGVVEGDERVSEAKRTNEGGNSDAGTSTSSSKSSCSEDDKKLSVTNPSVGSESITSSDSDSTSSDSDSSSSDSDTNSSDSDSEAVEAVEAVTEGKKTANVETYKSDSEDDFFVDSRGKGEADTFERAKQYSVGFDGAKSDKSKGWATQNQRPGQYKRRRERR